MGLTFRYLPPMPGAAPPSPFEWGHSQMEQTYRALLGWSVKNKLIVGALAIGSLFFMGYVMKLTGQEFVNAEDRGQFVVEAELPAGTSLDETARLSAYCSLWCHGHFVIARRRRSGRQKNAPRP